MSTRTEASPAAANSNLYEQEAVTRALGPALRPGGLELTRRALTACSLPTEAWALDVGCGRGLTVCFLREAAGLRALGVDASLALLEAGQGQEPPPWAAARAESLPFGQGMFGVIFCECVLSLLSEPAKALTEFRRVLAPGGRLVLSDLYQPCGPPPAGLAELRQGSCLRGALTRPALEALLTGAGFLPEVFEDHTRLLKELAARLILAHGSLAAFWGAALGAEGPPGAARALLGCRPGYFLLIARKGDRP